MSDDFKLEFCTNDVPRNPSSESHEERRKRIWKERLLRWKRKMGSEENIRAYKREKHKIWISKEGNRERQRQHQRAWEKRNPDKVRAKQNRTSKQRYQRHREKSLNAAKQWYRNHREIALSKARERHIKNRDLRLAYLKKWQKEHPEKNVEQNAKRRALELAAMGNLVSLKEFVRSTKSKRTVVCYYCQKRFSSKKLHFDHIIPLSKGGAHSVDNLCVSCSKCNLTKHARPIASLKLDGQQILNL